MKPKILLHIISLTNTGPSVYLFLSDILSPPEWTDNDKYLYLSNRIKTDIKYW